MVITLWRRRNRCWAAMSIQTLGRRTASILRYRLVRRDLLGAGAPGLLPFRQRRHGRAGGACRNRRFALLVTAAEADIGTPLPQRHPALRWIVFLLLTARLADFGLPRH